MKNFVISFVLIEKRIKIRCRKKQATQDNAKAKAYKRLCLQNRTRIISKQL